MPDIAGSQVVRKEGRPQGLPVHATPACPATAHGGLRARRRDDTLPTSRPNPLGRPGFARSAITFPLAGGRSLKISRERPRVTVRLPGGPALRHAGADAATADHRKRTHHD